jgi:RND family efflux transporter MFP subunit
MALALLAEGCSEDKSASQPQAVRRTVAAQVTAIQPSEAALYRVTPGTVIAQESVQIASRLMGYIRDIAVVEGQPVKAGQRLFTIDPLDIQGAVEQASLGLRQAEDAMKDAKTDFDRFESLYKDDVVSRQNYEKMKLNYEIAASRAAQARAGLATARGQLRYAVVTSPINGVVTRKLANQGDIAAPGHPVMMIENPARMQVETAVSEDIFRTLRTGDAIRVELDGLTQPVTAKVARLTPAADPMTHSYGVKLDISAPGLKSGAFARVLFPAGRHTLVAVPQTAVLDRAGITGVFVVDAQGNAQFRMIRTGKIEAGRVEVLSGLNSGERVVSGNALALQNGDHIQGY